MNSRPVFVEQSFSALPIGLSIRSGLTDYSDLDGRIDGLEGRVKRMEW